MNKKGVVVALALAFLFLRAIPTLAEPALQQTVLEPGVPVTGNLSGAGDTKYYQVTVTAGEYLSVILDGVEDYYPRVHGLYIKFGTLPTTLDYQDKGDLPDADQGVEITSTVAGTYYVMVQSTAWGGDYSIVAHTGSTFPTLTVGAPVTGTLQFDNDVKYYQVAVGAGEHLSVILDGVEDYYPRVHGLYIKFGGLPTTLDYLDKGDLPDADQGVEITSTVAGTYFVMVRTTAFGGDYSIIAHTSATFPTLTVGAPVTGALQFDNDVKYYQVAVGAGEHLSVILNGAEDFYPRKHTLFIKFGTLPTTLGFEDRGNSPGADQTVEIASTQAGTYYIMVRTIAFGGTYSIEAQTIIPISMSIGGTVQRQLAAAGRDDFVVTAASGENLAIELQPTAPITAPLVLLERFGRLSWPGPDEADVWTDRQQNGTYRLLVPDAIAGKHFISVFNQMPTSVVSYELRVLSMANRLVEVWPAVAPPAPVVLGARGVLRTGPLTITLCNTGNPAVTQGVLDPLSSSEGRITLDLTGVAPGKYNLCIPWPGGEAQTLADAVEVRAGSGQLVARLETPSVTRVGRDYVAWLTYGNSGGAPLPSPLFIVSADQAKVRLDADGEYTDTVRVTGFAADIPFDFLPPGGELRLPVYFRVTGMAAVLKLITVDAGNTQSFPWSSIEPLFRPLTPTSNWGQRWFSATTALGVTWGEVIQSVNDLGSVLTILPVPPSFDNMLSYRLGVALSETVAVTSQAAAQPAGQSAIPPEQDFVCPSVDTGLGLGHLYPSRFTYNARDDVELVSNTADPLDPNNPTFLIAHGNSDNAENPRFQDLENSIRLKTTKLGTGPINVARINWKGGANGIVPWAKTLCRNRLGRNVIEEVGKTLADNLRTTLGEQGRKTLCGNLVFYGHSFGNGVNYEVARNLCPDIKPSAMLLDAAAVSSGIHIRDYRVAFDTDSSFGVYTGVWFDEKKNLGVTARLLCGAPNGLRDPIGAHGYGLTWAMDAMDRCLTPSKPEEGAKFVTGGCKPEPGLGSNPSTGTPVNYPIRVVAAIDPNLKVAWAERLKPGDLARFTIYFENAASASAPAQDVVVSDALDPRFDWSSVRFVDAGFGSVMIPLQTVGFYESVESSVSITDYRPAITSTWSVNVQATLDRPTGHLRWTFRTLDPATGSPPEDPLAGFLPPNNASGRGEGHVTFDVRIRATTPDHTSITNTATIIFDANASIATPAISILVENPHEIYLPVVTKH